MHSQEENNNNKLVQNKLHVFLDSAQPCSCLWCMLWGEPPPKKGGECAPAPPFHVFGIAHVEHLISTAPLSLMAGHWKQIVWLLVTRPLESKLLHTQCVATINISVKQYTAVKLKGSGYLWSLTEMYSCRRVISLYTNTS